MIGDTKKIFEIMDMMAQVEQTMMDLYSLCAKKFPEDASLWSTLIAAEQMHIANVKQMSEMIHSHPEKFSLGRPFNPVAIGNFLAAVKNNMNEIDSGDCSRLNAISIAHDLEQSVIEHKFGEIVNTQDLVFKKLLSEILAQTNAHKTMIYNKIQELRKP